MTETDRLFIFLYTDEDVTDRLAPLLRERGYEAESVLEAGPAPPRIPVPPAPPESTSLYELPMEDTEMRQCLRFLLLTTLCTFFAVAAGVAQTPQPAASAPQAVPTVAEFLATLSVPGEVPGTGLLPPNPKLASTTCTSDADCAANEKCCYPCGIPDCNFVCMKVKRCPLFP